MLGISAWRLYDYVYRKYIRKYLNEKRVEKYLIQQEFENDERMEQEKLNNFTDDSKVAEYQQELFGSANIIINPGSVDNLDKDQNN